MNESVRLTGDVLSLKDDAFIRVRDSGDAFARGLAVLIAVALIVGLITAVVSFVGGVTAGPPAQQVERARQEMLRNIQTWQSLSSSSAENTQFLKTFEDNMNSGFQMATEIAQVAQQTTPLPAPIVDLFQALGRFVSYPWSRIGTWMFYSLLVLIAARLMGGTATVQEMLGVTALYSVPHLLDALQFIPCIGALLGILAFLWGLVIYVKGAAIANRFTTGKAIVAVVLPGVVVFLIFTIVLIAAVIFIAVLAGASGR